MEPTKSMSDSQLTRAFYLPASVARSRVPDRLERALTRRSSHLNPSGSNPAPVRPFYLPASAVGSVVPGRAQRAVTSLLRNRDERIDVPSVVRPIREFSMPGVVRVAKRSR